MRRNGLEQMKMPTKITSLLVAVFFATMAMPVDAAGKKKPRIGVGIGVGGVGIRVGPVRVLNKRKTRRNRRDNTIAPSMAARRAQGVYGGKILGVRLRGGVYIVKLRGSGRIRKVRVDARTGNILGR